MSQSHLLNPHDSLMRRIRMYTTLPHFRGEDTEKQKSQFLTSNHTDSNWQSLDSQIFSFFICNLLHIFWVRYDSSPWMTFACPDTPHIDPYSYDPPISYFCITHMSSSFSPIHIDISAPLTVRLPCMNLLNLCMCYTVFIAKTFGSFQSSKKHRKKSVFIFQ